MSNDRRITNPQDGRESDEARRNLSEHALDPRSVAGRDRATRVGDGGDKPFREQCMDALRGMRGELKNASAEMTQVNKDVEDGKLQPGSKQWQERMASACGKYEQAIKNADARLTPQTIDAIKQEQQVISGEIQLLEQARSQGRPLTNEEMQKLGLRSNDPTRALEDRKQQQMVLEDLTRSAGFACANYGLAMIRASAGCDQATKDQMIQQGQSLLMEGKARDPKQEQDPNFEKHYRRVMQIAGRDGGSSMQGPGGGRDGEVFNDNGQMVIRDGKMKIPTGDAQTDSAAFRAADSMANPFNILNKIEPPKLPLSPDTIQAYQAAIAAADNIDRGRLAQKITAETNYVNNALRGENGARIGTLIQQMDTAQAQQKVQHDTMAAYIPGVVAGPNGQPDQAISKSLQDMKNCKTFEELKAWEQQHPNEVRAIQQKPKGAELISTLEQFKNNDKIISQGMTELAKYDPNLPGAIKERADDIQLYKSSEITRIHFVRQLMQDTSRPAENRDLAQTYLRQLVKINPDLTSDRDFMEKAQFAGLQPDGKGGFLGEGETRPGTTPGVSTLNDGVVNAYNNALAAYQQVQDGKPLTAEQKAAFEQAVTATKALNPADVTAERQKLAQALTQAGWNDQLEAQFGQLNKAVQDNYGKIPQDKRTQIDQIQANIAALPPNDATANQQRQNLEGQLQGLSGDPAVKAWLDSRVQMANFMKQNGNAAAARMQYAQSDALLQNMEHSKGITEGLYGVALLRSGDAQNARAHLIEGARDPYVLQNIPDVQKAIQMANDPTIMQEAQRAGDSSRPTTDASAQPGQVTQQQAQLFDAAVASLGQAQQALQAVQKNGQPLEQQTVTITGQNGQQQTIKLDDVFKQAVQLTSQIDPKSLDAMQAQVQQKLLAGWTDADETKYKQTAADLLNAQNGVSQDAQGKIMQLQQSLAQDPQGPQKFQAGVAELAKTDPTVAKWVTAQQAAAQYHQDPKVQGRDQYEIATQQIAQLRHGKGIAETMYAAALGSTNNQQDFAKAKTLMQDALQDKELLQAFPQAADVVKGLGLQGGADMPAGQVDPELAKIPGFTQLAQAEQIMQDKSLTPQQRIEKAGPLYQKAIEESGKINTTKLDQDLMAIGTKLKDIEAGAQKVANDPAALEKYKTEHAAEYQQLSADADKLSNMRLEPMKARLMAAIAYNGAAAELYEQAGKDAANKDKLTKQADDWNKQAADTLRSLEKADPRMWRENPTIQGAIVQAEQHKKIDPSAANAMGQVQNVQKMVDFGVNGPIKGFQPLWMSMNAAGDALGTVGKIPVVGFIPGALGSGLSRAEEVRPGAAMALAMAKNKDEKGANDMVGSIRHQMLNQGAYTVENIASAYGGMALGRLAVNMLPDGAGALVKGLTFAGVGFGGTVAANKTLDWAANKALGVDQRDTAELLFQSGATFGMTWGLQGMSNYKTMQTNNFLSAEAGAAKPSFMQAMKVWEPVSTPITTVGQTYFDGTKIQIPKALNENWMGLTAEGKAAVGDALKAKFTGEQFAAMSGADQYKAFLNAYNTGAKGLAVEAAGGSKWMARMPFSGNMDAARTLMGDVDKPWMFSGKGRFAYNFGTGAGSMAIYGLGDVNPFLTNKQTGEKYSLGDTFTHMGTNAAWGGFGSAIAAPVVGKAMDFAVKKPLEYTMGRPIQWLFNSEAAAASAGSKFTGLSELTPKATGDLLKGYSGFWQVGGENALKAAGQRFAVGFGGAGGLGMLTHNPWMVNPETGKNYTWGESAGYGGKWGLYGGGGLAVAPYAMFGGKWVLENGGKGLYNKTIVPLSETGPVTWTVNGIKPAINNTRVFLGTQSDRVLKNPAVTGAWDSMISSKPAQALQSGWQRYAAVSLVPTTMLEGQGAGDLYGYYEWGRINAEADAILKAAREKEAQQKTQGQQPVPAK